MADAGIKLGVEGEREFKNALKGINESMKTLNTEMKLVTSEFDKNDKSAKALKAQYNVISEQVATQKDKVNLLSDALKKSSEEFGENDKRTEEWRRKLNLAQADLNKMEDGLKKTKDALFEARMPSTAFANAIDGIKGKIDDFTAKPKRLIQELKPLTAPFKAAGNAAKTFGTAIVDATKAAAEFSIGALKTAAVGSAAAITGISAAATAAAIDVAAVGDQVDKSSQKLKLSRQGYQEWAYVLSQNGADVEQLSGSMASLVNNIRKVTSEKPNAEVTAMFKEIGISMDDIKKDNPEEIFNSVVKGLQGMDDETRKAVVAQKLLGGSASNLMPLLNSTAEATNALKEKANALGMVMNDDAVTSSAAFTDSMDNLKRSISGIKNSMTAELLPGFTMVTDGLLALVIGEEDAAEQIKIGVENIVQTISDMLPKIIEVIGDVLPYLIDALVDAIPDLIKMLWDSLTKIVSSMSDFFEENKDEIKDSGMRFINMIADGVKNAVKFLVDNKGEIFSAGIDILKGLWNGIASMVSWVVENFSGILNSFVEKIPEYAEKLKENGPDLIHKLFEGALSVGEFIFDQAWELIKAIANALVNALPLILDVGKQLIFGLWDGIKSAKDSVVEKIKGVGSDIVDGVKDIFGIHSPSKVFAGIGKNLALGLDEGFSDEMKGVSKKMDEAIPKKFSAKIDAAVSVPTQRPQAYEYTRGSAVGMQKIILQVGERELGSIVIDSGNAESRRLGLKTVLA